MKLNKCLVRAKKNTYAASAKEVILEDGARELIYEEDVFKYRDRYYGFNPFSGQELVLKNNELEWVMNYYGMIFSDKIMGKTTEEEIYIFLRDALKNVYADAPYRGPSKFESGNLTYFCNFDGEILRFKRKEFIHHNHINCRMSCLEFHGGNLKQNARD
ncbi:MAG: DUF5680 domain-containing protein [Nanoarchaeota archaeon]